MSIDVIARPETTRTARLFLDGERRLRTGWRLSAYLMVVMSVFAGVGLALRGDLASNVAGHAAVAASVVAVTYAFRRWVDRRPWRDIGLSSPRPREALIGCVAGALAIGVVLALGWGRVTGTELADRGPGGVLVLLVAGLFMYATSALVQELSFRGYVLQTLADGWSMRGAAVVSGVIFTLLHFSGVTGPALAVVLFADLMLISGFFVLTRLRTGALWLVIGFHTTWNWVMDDVLSMDTDVDADYGDALVHVRLDAPELLLGPNGGVEWIYLGVSAALFGGYWLWTSPRPGSSRSAATADRIGAGHR